MPLIHYNMLYLIIDYVITYYLANILVHIITTLIMLLLFSTEDSIMTYHHYNKTTEPFSFYACNIETIIACYC